MSIKHEPLTELPPDDSTSGLCILTARGDTSPIDNLLDTPEFAHIEAYPHTGAFGRNYHASIHGRIDRSFAVCVDGAAALICLCAPLAGKLSYYGMPLRLTLRRNLDDDTVRVAVNLAFSHLDRLAAAQESGEAIVYGESGSLSSLIGQACRLRGGTASIEPIAYVDLTAGPTAWRAALRKSSRSLINWGRRNLVISCVDQQRSDRILFDQYRQFHADISGRVTRTEASWSVMYDWIARGNGELILGFLEGRLVAGSMFIDGNTVCIYASGVYDRSQFDKPLAHYPVWLGIDHAQARGMKTLELGAVPPRDAVSDKEYQIGYFKRGFATHVEDHIVWRWSPTATS